MPVNITRNTPISSEVPKLNLKLELTPIQIDIDIPKLESLPFGLQTELLMLQSQVTQEQISTPEYMFKALCIFTQMNPPGERLSYAQIKNLEFPLGTEGLQEQTKLMSEHISVARELLDGLQWGESGKAKAKKEPKKAVN